MSETKKCPMCAETIPAASTTCEYCGAQFKVTSIGYCTNCHAVRDAGEAGHCRVCGNAVTDWRVESQLVETPPLPPAASPPFPAPATPVPFKKKGWGWWVVGGAIGLVLLAAVVAVIVLFNTGALHLPVSVPIATPTSTPDLAATSQSSTATSQAGTIDLWYSYTLGSQDETTLFTVIHNAETEFPGLHVIATNQSASGNFIYTYNNFVSSGSGPDIILAQNDYLGDMVRRGTVLNLAGYVTQDRLADYKQYALDGMAMDGKLYGLPVSAGVVALYYNKSMVPNPPTTTNELLSLVKNGQNLEVPDGASYYLYGIWSAYGVQLMDESGRCNASQGEFVPAIQYLRDLKKAGAHLQEEFGTATWDHFGTGKAAMLINGQWALPDLRDSMGDKLGVALLPNGPAGSFRPITGLNGFFINPNTANPELAVQLALFMTNQASAQMIADQTKSIPVINDATISDPLLYTFSLQAGLGAVFPQEKGFANYWGPFNEMFGSVLSGNAIPQSAIQQACDSMNSLNGLP
jgi:arabinogalactan oligomer / maltooligosaccharide transport system substrate-binding protein